jgi:predicted nucleic acid-binding protein
MADIEQRLSEHRLIGLDTAVFIYHLEGHPKYLSLTRSVLRAVQSGVCQGVVSTVTIMELTVHPWRVNRADVARQYEMLLANFPNLKLIDVNRDVARRAAQLRARYNLRPADALQVATALLNHATLWVSNDKKLKRLEPEIAVIGLDDFAEP